MNLYKNLLQIFMCLIFSDFLLQTEVSANQLSQNFKVSSQGAATYSVHLSVPPGTAGVEPELAVSYNNQSGLGMVGKGWNLSGLSHITRCPKTLTHDGTIRGIGFDGHDRFCMEGQRLVAISGSYGADGTVYRSERESWTQLVSEGNCGGSPCSFIAKTKLGFTMEYGRVSNARISFNGMGDVPYLWALNKVSDRNGNFWKVDYYRESHAFYPKSIIYTGNDQTGLNPIRKISFTYQNLNNYTQIWRSGVKEEHTKILASIETSVGGQLVKQYRFNYEFSPYSKSELLKKILDCSPNGECMLLADLSYSSPAIGLNGSPSFNLPAKAFHNELNGWRVKNEGITRDINGDGITDFTWGTCWIEGGCNLRVYHGTENGFVDAGYDLPGKIFKNEANDWRVKTEGILQDINGDGFADYSSATCMDNGSCDLRVYHSTGSGFVDAGYNLPGKMFHNKSSGWEVKNEGVLQDINGDGITDFTRATCWDNGTCDLRVFHGTGSGFVYAGYELPGKVFHNEVSGWRVRTEGIIQDFNGDGLSDFSKASCGTDGNCNLRVYHGTGSGFVDAGYDFPGKLYHINADGWETKTEAVLQDLNGDGIIDFSRATCWDDGRPCSLRVYHGTGKGFVDAGYDLPGKIFQNHAEGWETKTEGTLQDFNGDGIADFTHGTCWSDGNCKLRIYHGTGKGFYDAGYDLPSELYHNNHQGWESKNQGIIRDFNGDGLGDFSSGTCWSDGNCDLGVHLNHNVNADVLTTMSDQLSGKVSINYQPLTRSQVYQKGNNASYPDIDVQHPSFVVSSYKLQDGRGHEYNLSYRYHEAKVDLRGRGWLGFRKVVETNHEAKLVTTIYYHQTYSLQGLWERQVVSDSQGRKLKESRLTYQHTQTYPGVYRVEARQARNDVYLSGDYDYTLGKNFEYDEYGNTTVTHDLGDLNDPSDNLVECSQYENDTAQWQLGLLKIFKVTRDSSQCSNSNIGQFSDTADFRLGRFEWDERFNLKREEYYRDTDQKFIPTDYYYDAYGNRIKSQTALGFTKEAKYDDLTHTFPVEMVSPPNEDGQRLITTAEYSLGFGTLTSQTDANGNVFTFKYDAFGRMTERLGPDSDNNQVTLESWNFSFCSNRDDCDSGMVVTHKTRPNWTSSDSSDWLWRLHFYDGLGRHYLSRGKGGDDGDKIVEIRKEYDAQGRVQRESLPYFVGDVVPWSTNTYDIHNSPIKATDPLGASHHYCNALGNDSFTIHDTCPSSNAFQAFATMAQRSSVQDNLLNENDSRSYEDIVARIENSINNKSELSRGNKQTLITGPDPRLRDDGDSQLLKSLSNLNAQGHVIKQQAVDGSEVNYTYNRMGEIISSSDAKGAVTRYTYNSLGQVIKIDDNSRGVSFYRYDDNSRLIESKDNKRTLTKITYDQLDRIIKREIIGTSESADEIIITKFGYDDRQFANSRGRLSWVAWREYDEDHHTWINYRKALAYDKFGRPIISQLIIESPDRKLHFLGNTHIKSFVSKNVLNPTGQIAEHIYPDGSKVTYTYNESMHLKTVEFQESDRDGELGPTMLIASLSDYSALGQHQNIRFGNGVDSSRAFDLIGRMITGSTTLSDASIAEDISYTWNKAGKLYSLEDNTSGYGNQSFHYDIRGRMSRAEGPYGTKTYGYDLSGNPTQLGNFTFAYNPTKVHQLMAVRDHQGKVIGDYSYDLNGNLTMQPYLDDYDKRPLRKWFYTYDLNNRLKQVKFGNSLQGSKVTDTFTYDPYGQRLKKTSREGRITLYVSPGYEIALLTPGKQIHTRNIFGNEGVVASITEEYEKDMNTMAFDNNARKILRDAFDSGTLEGFLKKLLYLIEELGQLLINWLPKTLELSMALSMMLAGLLFSLRRSSVRIWLRSGLNRSLITYPLVFAMVLYGQPTTAIAALKAGPNGKGIPSDIRYLHQNHQMSSTLVTNATGQEVARVAYEPFGRIVESASQGEDSFRQKYTGKEYDEESELYYFGSRYYDPVMGRFLTPDPAWQYQSPYVYGDNDPLSGIDPDGELFFLIGLIILGVTVGGYFGGVAANGGNFNPAEWDWTSGKTWAGIFVGGIIGGISGGAAAYLAGAGAGIGAVIAAEGVLGAVDGLAMGAINGHTGLDLLTDGLLGFGLGAAFGGVFEGVGRALSSLGRSGSTIARQSGKSCPTSFPAGTLILQEDGYGQIEDMRIGDQVWAYNEESGQLELKTISHLFTRVANDIIKLKVDGEVITTTEKHPFYVDGEWKEAKDIQVGDRIKTSGGVYAVVESVGTASDSHRVFNFEVNQHHNYFVSKKNLLAHNCEIQPAIKGDIIRNPGDKEAKSGYNKVLSEVEWKMLDRVDGTAETLFSTGSAGSRLDWQGSVATGFQLQRNNGKGVSKSNTYGKVTIAPSVIARGRGDPAFQQQIMDAFDEAMRKSIADGHAYHIPGFDDCGSCAKSASSAKGTKKKGKN